MVQTWRRCYENRSRPYDSGFRYLVLSTSIHRRHGSTSCDWNGHRVRIDQSPLAMQKIALFADVQNIYYTTREKYGRSFDYRALWRRVEAGGEIVAATAYAIDSGVAGQTRFQSALRHIGFNVKLKPFIQRSDGSAKGDWDVGITIDLLTMAADVDTVVLLSGDGDFDLLVETVRQRHSIATEVYGVPGLTSRSLIAAASTYHPIEADLLM